MTEPIDFAARKAQMVPVYLRCVKDLHTIGHHAIADLVDRERVVLYGELGAPEPVGIMHVKGDVQTARHHSPKI
jgi:hypothetical protein